MNNIRCYNCTEEINRENQSLEHIIPNACGGRLTSRDLLCKECNSYFGEKWDAALAKTTNAFANLLMITRDRGEPQSEKGVGLRTQEEFKLPPGKPPVLSKPTIIEDLKNGEIEIHANSEKELRKVLEGYKRTYPEIDVEKALASTEHKREYFDQAVNLKVHIGGPEVLKAIVKIAVNFFIHKGGGRDDIKHLLPYLKGTKELNIVWLYHPEERVYAAGIKEVPHVIKIIGDPKEGVLYAYVELFDTHSFIVLLNENYKDAPVDLDYVFDVVSQTSKENVTKLTLVKNDIIEILKQKPFNINKVRSRIDRVRKISNKLHDHREIDKIIRNAVKVFEKESEGVLISEEAKNKFLEQVSLDFAKFMLHKQNSVAYLREDKPK
ncbi:HNH endonuclease [Aquimarina sp. MAR_2010_214]|uniref:HNH endonuclease n=1 Tax=Aquimarina sp. MAR_2010_214 TaxID=1250026 RepID=UPI000C7140F5|nr:HNH endonuclease [Aquimarina sp. MAR_2010_214]PKV49215.1 HNH endonuclease [Aquimarina sp. MAR_2010_214]